MGTEGTYQKIEDVEVNRSTTEIIGDKENKFSLKSAFNTLSLRRKKYKEKIKASNISKDAEEPIYDVIDDSKINRDSVKERSRLRTPLEEIWDARTKHPELINIFSQIYSHEKYPVIEELSEFFDNSTDTGTKMAFQIALKKIMDSLNIFGEKQDLLNLALDCVLILSKHKLWGEFIKTNNEKNEKESDEGNYETIEKDYETIKEEGDYQVMKNRIGEEDKEKEPDYMNVKESDYMPMSGNGGRKPGFFAANATVEKENKEAQQEESPQIVSTLN